MLMSKKTNLFWTADWHIDHANCLKFDERPFTSLEEMRAVLAYNYNKQVKQDDTCIFLGDIAYKPHRYIDFFRSLNGTKILVRGNHDGSTDAFYHAGFTLVLNSFAFSYQGLQITASHCPLLNIYRENVSSMGIPEKSVFWHGDYKTKHRSLSMNDYGQDVHIHGHIHSRKDKPQSQKILGKQYDVGVTANNFRPIRLSDIIKSINKNYQELKTI